MKQATPSTVTRSQVLTPALWKTLASTRRQPPPATDPLLFLYQGVFHDGEVPGFAKLRVIQEMLTLETFIDVYLEGAQEPLSTRVSVQDARFYSVTQDIIHQDNAFYSVIFKVLSYSDGVPVYLVYLWPIPPISAPQSSESDSALYLYKGSTIYISADEEDIVMDRTFRVSDERLVSVNIRTVEGHSYSTTVTATEAARCARPGDYYVEYGSDELCMVYGVSTESALPRRPKIKYTPLPTTPRSRHDPGV